MENGSEEDDVENGENFICFRLLLQKLVLIYLWQLQYNLYLSNIQMLWLWVAVNK